MDTRHGSFARPLLSTDDQSHHEASGQDEHEEQLVNARWRHQAFRVGELVDGPAAYQYDHGKTITSNDPGCFETEIVETMEKALLDQNSGNQAHDWFTAQIVSYL
jgi:hypothetical protein